MDKMERKILNLMFFWLIFAYILVRIIPLRWFSPFLGKYNDNTVFKTKFQQLNIVTSIKKSLLRVKKRLPWKVKCFEEAIALKKVLLKFNINSTLYLGINKKNKTELGAHAWLKCGKSIIAGKNGHENFAIVAFYR